VIHSRAIVLPVMGILLAAALASAEKPPATDAPPTGAGPKVLATVGKAEITDAKVDAIISRYRGIKPDQVAAARKRILEQLIQRELTVAYLRTAPCPADKLAQTKQMLTEKLKPHKVTLEQYLKRMGKTEADLRLSVAMQTLQAEAASDEKADALVKSSPPAYFDGTELNASHILIMSPVYASQPDRTSARQKLAEIAKQIKAGDVTFEAAAKKHSACPSGKDGGALGKAFTFAVMDVGFSKAAFAMKVNELSGIVPSSFGFHLIKVTKRTEGTGTPGSDARKAARRMLLTALQVDIIRKSAAANPVVIK